MQSNITLTGINRVFCKISMALAFLFLISGTMQAQTYVNGNLGTGATSNNGTAAPAGTTWHELQNNTGNTTESNSTLGVSHVSFGTTNNTLADDFTVPAGQTWNITTLRIYSLDQVTTTTTSPYNNIRVRIYNGVPGAGGTVVYGDMTTNRFAATAYTAKRAIFNSQVPTPGTPTPNLPVFSIDATINTSLTAGTYWIEWQVVNTVNCFSLTSQTPGVRALAGANARQSIAGAWAPLIDGGSPATAPDVNIELPFSLNYTATGAACTAVSPGNTISSVATVCPSTPFNLSVQTPGSGVGLAYQWQSSPNNTTYTDIAAATNPTYTASQIAATWYRLRVTCGANPALFSTPVNVAMSTACYCIPAASDCTDGDIITNVTFGTLNNPSTCGAAGYTNYTTNTSITVPDVILGGSSPISVTAGDGTFTENVGVWIDYNHNGVFDASEFTAVGLNAANPIVRTGNIAVPATALLGTTRMRVRVRFSTQLTGADPCTAYTFGETEDYTVNIIPCVQVAITGSPASSTISCGGNASFTVTATGSLPAYQWEFKTTAAAAWQLITAATSPVYSGINTNVLQLTSAPVSFNGYQYRAIVSGACTGPDFSSAATLTVNPFALAVTPSSGSVCSTGGTPVLLTVPNNTTVTSFVNNTTGAIPDAPSTTGLTRAIAVSGITGSILNATLKLNISHTWVGDLGIALKAPNGQIMSMDYYLTGTGGASATTGFVNTILNSANTTPLLNSGTNPWSSTFAADGTLAATVGLTDAGPTGFTPTTNSWAAMFAGGVNGTWTLGFVDGGAGDAGTFNDATLAFTSGSAPATAVFSPVTGLYTNAAATTAYTGTAVSQVYALPTATTTYTAVVSTSTCATAPQSIVITVNTPVAGTPTVASQTTCATINATFSVAGITGGTGLTYQWQVSTPTAPTFVNIAGATSATYTVSGPASAQNGNQYRVVVSSAGCTATTLTSTAGTLTVNPAPVVVISASPSTTVIPGSTVTLTAAVSPNGAASYQWYNNGVAVAGATNNTLVVGIDGIGSYTVKVTDANGCTNGAQASTPGSIVVTTTATTQLFIYPSPNTGKFQVRYFNDLNDGPNGPAILNVYDSKGSRVFTRRYVLGPGYQSMAVDLASHGKGVYRVDLLNTNGERIKTGNVLVY
jgi:subtilisin-like proprotein convertase family protein